MLKFVRPEINQFQNFSSHFFPLCQKFPQQNTRQPLSKYLKNDNLRANQIRAFKLSPRRPINPLLVIFVKTKGLKVAHGLTVWLTRYFRKKYIVADDHRLKRSTVAALISSFTLGAIGYYTFTHYDTTPLTGRKRWITFTREQMEALSDIAYEKYLEKCRFLDKLDARYCLCADIVEQIVSSNQDCEELKRLELRLNVVDDDSVVNAMVLPNGQIFVYTGIMKFLSDPQELAVVIGHEIAHAVLGHAQVCVQLLFCCHGAETKTKCVPLPKSNATHNLGKV